MCLLTPKIFRPSTGSFLTLTSCTTTSRELVNPPPRLSNLKYPGGGVEHRARRRRKNVRIWGFRNTFPNKKMTQLTPKSFFFASGGSTIHSQTPKPPLLIEPLSWHIAAISRTSLFNACHTTPPLLVTTNVIPHRTRNSPRPKSDPQLRHRQACK